MVAGNLLAVNTITTGGNLAAQRDDLSGQLGSGTEARRHEGEGVGSGFPDETNVESNSTGDPECVHSAEVYFPLLRPDLLLSPRSRRGWTYSEGQDVTGI